MQRKSIIIVFIVSLLGFSWPMQANDDKDILIKSRMQSVIKELRFLRDYTKKTQRMAGNGSNRMKIEYDQIIKDLDTMIDGLSDMVDYNPKKPKAILEKIEEVTGDYSI